MPSCPTCGRPLSAEGPCPHCTPDPEATRMATGRRGPENAPAPEQQAPYQQPPPPYPQQPAYAQPPYGGPEQPYGAGPQYPQPYGQAPPQLGQPIPPAPSRGPSKGRIAALVGGGAAMLVVIGLGAWAVTSMGSDGDGRETAESSAASPSAEPPSPSPSASAEQATEPDSTATPVEPDSPDATETDETSTTYDLASGSQSIDLTIVVDGPTTVTASPDAPEDIVLVVNGPRGVEACRSDASFVNPESCTLNNPQVGAVYDVVVSTYSGDPGGTGTVEIE